MSVFAPRCGANVRVNSHISAATRREHRHQPFQPTLAAGEIGLNVSVVL